MFGYDLVQTWIPASMIGVLFLLILLDSLWLAYKARKDMQASAQGSTAQTKWHEQNKSNFAQRQWHEKNREILRNR